ncbi:hypothetical protein MKW92_035425 [Papaver armeniacum]|nr:hypothetical protein MKW92_035425 [Papaver armeniacum]
MEKINQKLPLSDEEEEVESSGSKESADADDDSEEDTTSDVLEESRSNLSRFPLKKLNHAIYFYLFFDFCRISKVIESGNDEEEPDDVEIKVPKTSKNKKVPELNAKDANSFETVQKIIAGGQFEKLKVEQCKVYLRKYGLRLMGKKDVLINRIKEHLGIINGGGEQKYPESSFVCDCKGDACTGDVVMFEQNVYEMYNISSRSSAGPPCGTRTVVGRVVRDSYGSAKQQHTFTIEVLWSKGVKPLPPLHPLLIKGRNLYKLKTIRQLWEDEEIRQKVLLEKHSRGSLAKSNRKTRIQQKKKTTLCAVCRQRVSKNEISTVPEPKRRMSPDELEKKPASRLQNKFPAVSTRQPTQIREDKPAFPPKIVLTEVHMNTKMDSITTKQHPDGSIKSKDNNGSNGYQVANTNLGRAPSQRQVCKYYPQGRCRFGDKCKYLHEEPPIKRQLCRFYARGWCYHGENCKYLHERR